MFDHKYSEVDAYRNLLEEFGHIGMLKVIDQLKAEAKLVLTKEDHFFQVIKTKMIPNLVMYRIWESDKEKWKKIAAVWWKQGNYNYQPYENKQHKFVNDSTFN